MTSMDSEDEFLRLQRRLEITNADRRQWRERALAAEEALGLFGCPELADKTDELIELATENTYRQCPACGVSFEVKSETSQRIFCSGACRSAR